MFADGASGLHHVALIVDDLNAALAGLNAAGFDTGLYAEVAPSVGSRWSTADRRSAIFSNYTSHAGAAGRLFAGEEASIDWDGDDVIRDFGF